MIYNRVNFDKPEEKKEHIKMVDSLRGTFDVVYDFWGEKRTNDLNTYYQVRLKLIREATGYTTGFLDWFFKVTYLPNIIWPTGAPFSSSGLSVIQMLEYLESIEEWEEGFFFDDSMDMRVAEYNRIIKPS